LATEELANFLLQQCRDRRLSLRALSMKAGLSPATVHCIINRTCQPSLSSLNRLADYLEVKREYLWQLAGLVEDTDYSTTKFSDPQLRFHFDRVDKLPKAARNQVISVVDKLILFLEEREPHV
jgi:transcriptional regulator with XRE-family HTH domain